MIKQLFFVFFFFTTQVFADAVFPLSSGRPQREGNCWAYGAAHMIESKVQSRDGISIMTNLQKSYRYWLIYDRLLNSFHRKMIDNGDETGTDLNEVGGFAADLFYIYEHHGLEWLYAVSGSKLSDLVYPTKQAYANSFQPNRNSQGLHKPSTILQAERQLVANSMTESEAIALIQQTLKSAFVLEDTFLDQTPGLNTFVPVNKTFEQLLGPDFHSAQNVILLSSSLSKLPDRNWFRYSSDRYLAISYKEPKDILVLVRASLDRGWPTTFESVDHVMTALGYKTLADGSFVYAISDSSGAYLNREGISWIPESAALNFFRDATVNYEVLSDLLPPQQMSEALLPSLSLARKH